MNLPNLISVEIDYALLNKSLFKPYNYKIITKKVSTFLQLGNLIVISEPGTIALTGFSFETNSIE